MRRLYLCRHGESEANVANARAIAAGAETLGPLDEDALVGLTPRGIEQAQTLGAYFARCAYPPVRILTSPYERCYRTAALAGCALELGSADIVADARLRERALGVLDRLTPMGIRARFPDEAVRRSEVGKFAYRPPQGESWMDVAQRVAPLCDGLRDDERGGNIAIVTHQAVILCMRYVIEELRIETLTQIDAAAEVANCAVTMYEAVEGRLTLRAYNADPSQLETLRA